MIKHPFFDVPFSIYSQFKDPGGVPFCLSYSRIPFTKSNSIYLQYVNKKLVNNFQKESLQFLLIPEKLEGDNLYNCKICNSYQNAERGTQYLEFPPILIMHLLRFEQDLVSGRSKLHHRYLSKCIL